MALDELPGLEDVEGGGVGLAQELQQGDGESGGADGMSGKYRAEVFVDAHLKLAQIGFGGECWPWR
jgi:hypothetical protein